MRRVWAWPALAWLGVLACSGSTEPSEPRLHDNSDGTTGDGGATGIGSTTGGSVTGESSTTGGEATSGGTTGGAGNGGEAATRSTGASSGEATVTGAMGGSGGASPSGEDEASCREVADALCSRLQTCSPFAISVVFGDESTCEERSVLGCLAALGASGTSLTAASNSACGAALPSFPCEDLAVGMLPPECTPAPGALLNGEVCFDDAQCQSTFCARSPHAQCGECSALTAAGDPCVNQACSRGLACSTEDSRCVVPVRGQAGATCSDNNQCDVANGIGCNTATNECITGSVASSATGSCGVSLLGNSAVLCPASGSCSSLLAGTCAPSADDGAACSTSDTGAHCMPPAVCSDGTCRLLSQSGCP